MIMPFTRYSFGEDFGSQKLFSWAINPSMRCFVILCVEMLGKGFLWPKLPVR